MAEVAVVVTAGNGVTVDQDHLLREDGVLREDQGAHVTAGALSSRGVHLRRREGSAMPHQMREAHGTEEAVPLVTVGWIIVLVPKARAGARAEAEAKALLMMQRETTETGDTQGQLEMMAAAVALVLCAGMTEALLMKMMIIMVRQGAVNQLKCCMILCFVQTKRKKPRTLHLLFLNLMGYY